MKIIVVNNFFPPRPGGSSHLASKLAKYYALAGNEVIVITANYRNAPREETVEGYKIIRLDTWNLPKNRLTANFDIGFTYGLKNYRKLKKILDDFSPDIIHQHGQFFDLTWQTGWWAKKNKVPTLLSIHTRLYSPKFLHNLIYKIADFVLVKPLMAIHKPVLVIMDKYMNLYCDSRYKGAFSRKVNIPVGVDTASILSGKAEEGRALLAKYGVSSEKIILSVGHVIPQRNRVPLVKAMPAILNDYPDAKLVVVGHPYNTEYQDVADQLGVSDAVVSLGMQPSSEIPNLLAIASLECHEIDGQGFGTASLEALAAGVPVVAGVEEDNFLDIRITDGSEMYLVDLDYKDNFRAKPDSLARVITMIMHDFEKAKKIVSENARNFVINNFDIEIVTKKYLNTLEGMVHSDSNAR